MAKVLIFQTRALLPTQIPIQANIFPENWRLKFKDRTSTWELTSLRTSTNTWGTLSCNTRLLGAWPDIKLLRPSEPEWWTGWSRFWPISAAMIRHSFWPSTSWIDTSRTAKDQRKSQIFTSPEWPPCSLLPNSKIFTHSKWRQSLKKLRIRNWKSKGSRLLSFKSWSQ